MKISIAMATFNGAKYLGEQLETFISQERTPEELVVCDDSSTDATLSILEEFKCRAPFEVIVVKNDQNLGFTKNFEKALSICTGDLIFLSDQDDYWFPNKVSAVEKAFLENPDKSLVIHNGELADGNLVSHGMTKLGQIVAGYGSNDSFITGTSKRLAFGRSKGIEDSWRFCCGY
jgi:glycosyltransferase involved in cell wall biosynthesis